MSRNKEHELIINKIEESNFNCLFYVATGSGKTRILIESIKKLNPKSVLWTCATEKFRAQGLKEEFDKWEGDFSIIKPICWHSLGSCKEEFDLIVLDEIQMMTKRRFSYFKKHKPSHIIACSGTESGDFDKKSMIDSLGIKKILQVGVDEAVEKGLISNYEVEIRYCELDNITKKQIKPGFAVTDKQTYDWYTNKINELREEGEWELHKRMSLARARFIYNCKSKLLPGLSIVRELRDKRTIIFSKSTDIANQLSHNTFHTVMDKKLANENYSNFNSYKESHISVVEAANTSLNFVDIEVVYIHQLDSNPVNFLQKQGRGLRIRENYKAKIIILCMKDTQDEIWVNKCIESLKNINHVE